MRAIERVFEAILWNSRFIVLIAVVASVFTSLVLFYISTVDVVFLPSHLTAYHDPGLEPLARAKIYNATVADIAGIIDGYLFATIMFIFALGLYELFISKIEMAESNEFAERILLINSLDDLKDRLAKVIFLILVVKYFEYALEQHFDTPLALLEFAVGIVLIAAALWLTRSKH